MRQALRGGARSADTRRSADWHLRGELAIELLAVAGNRTRTDCDPTAHAEILALREAARKLGNYRLAEAVVYSTIEPCAMCAGALIQARVKRLVYGATDEKAGAVESHFRICDTDQLNHRVEITPGSPGAECRELMQEFFQEEEGEKEEAKGCKRNGARTNPRQSLFILPRSPFILVSFRRGRIVD